MASLSAQYYLKALLNTTTFIPRYQERLSSILSQLLQGEVESAYSELNAWMEGMPHTYHDEQSKMLLRQALITLVQEVPPGGLSEVGRLLVLARSALSSFYYQSEKS